MEELKPCPFCAADTEELGLTVDPNPPPADGKADWGVQCYVCHVSSPFYDTQAEAVAAWNRRAQPPAAEGYREALAKTVVDAESQYLLHIPRMRIRPLTWEEHKAHDGGTRYFSIADAILSAGWTRAQQAPEPGALPADFTEMKTRAEKAEAERDAAQAAEREAKRRLEVAKEALEPFAYVGELLVSETTGFHDLDGLELYAEDGSHLFDRPKVGTYRRALAAFSSLCTISEEGAPSHGE